MSAIPKHSIKVQDLDKKSNIYTKDGVEYRLFVAAVALPVDLHDAVGFDDVIPGTIRTYKHATQLGTVHRPSEAMLYPVELKRYLGADSSTVEEDLDAFKERTLKCIGDLILNKKSK